MKKTIIASFLGLAITQLNAYTVNLSQVGLNGNDKFGYVTKSQKGNCKPTETSGRCALEEHHSNGMFVKYIKNVARDMSNTSKNERLKEFTITINGQSFPNCNHLEAKNGNKPMYVNVILTPDGCK